MTEKTKFEKAVEEFQLRNFDQRYVGASISNLDLPEWVVEKIIKFMKEPKHFLVFLSKPGIGKTYMCSGLVEWALQKFRSIRYHRESKLLARLRQGISDDSGDWRESLQFLVDDDLVMLDDVASGINPARGKSRDAKWSEEVFLEFLDIRYHSQKPTIITSNFSKQDFENIYSWQVEDRLFSEQNTIIEIFDDSIPSKRKMGM